MTKIVIQGRGGRGPQGAGGNPGVWGATSGLTDVSTAELSTWYAYGFDASAGSKRVALNRFLAKADNGRFGFGTSNPSACFDVRNPETGGAPQAAFYVENRFAGSTGYDVRQYPTAGAACFVGHQYSHTVAIPGAILDQIGPGACLQLNNRENANFPGYRGTGNFYECNGWIGGPSANNYGAMGYLNHQLQFAHINDTNRWAFATGLIVNAPSGGAGSAFDALSVTHGKAGKYAVNATGVDFGANVTTTANGGFTFAVTKNGSGAGDAQIIINKGSGATLVGFNGTVNTFSFAPNGDLTIAGNKVLGARGAALPADATDAATAAALSNAIKARLIAHGLTA